MVSPSSSVYGPSSGPWPSTAVSTSERPPPRLLSGRRRRGRRRAAGPPPPDCHLVHRSAHARARRRAVLQRHLDDHQQVRVRAERSADSPFMVTPDARTSDSRSAVSGARWPLLLKNSRCPQLPPPHRVADVVDDRHARALARHQQRQHRRVLARRLVVEDHRPERRLPVARDGQERRLRADQRVPIALRQQRAALDLALVRQRHVARRVGEQLAQADVAERAARLSLGCRPGPSACPASRRRSCR